MPDPSALDAALVAKLSADTGTGGLMTLMTDGVYMDIAPSGKTKFVIVSLVMAEDAYAFGAALEKALYLVKAVDRNVSGTVVKLAAARIQTLLQDQPLTVSGYTHMATLRQERVRYTEVDPEDQDTRWQHRGGRYEITVSPS